MQVTHCWDWRKQDAIVGSYKQAQAQSGMQVMITQKTSQEFPSWQNNDQRVLWHDPE